MRQLERSFLIAVVVGMTATFSAKAATDAVSFKTLVSHLPKAMAKMLDIGKLDESQVLPVTIALQLNNNDELDARIAEMYRSGSPTFHQFMTPAEFKARYSPTGAQVAAETAFLASKGIQVQSVSDNRVLIHAQASVATLNQVFKTEVHQYRHSSGQVYFAPAYDLKAPSTSQIAAVIGMSNLSHMTSHLKVSDQPQGILSGGFGPSDIRTAYNIPSSADGSGQTLGLFELDGYTASDITGYEQKYGLPNVQLQNVLIDGSSGAAGSGAVEVTLDIEMMAAVAPNASKILVYEGPNSSQGMIDTFERIASDNLAKQISTSWGQPESQSAAADLQSENTILKQMVAQGQAMYAAAGDSGAKDDGSTLGVDDPASQPYVIGVGGTKLTTGTNSAYTSETTWNELHFISLLSEGAGGGGISTVWSQPSWQNNASAPDSACSTTMRNVPDVSLNADPVTGYAVYQGGKWEPVGGTSAAAPLWAAFNALVNQQRASNGMSSIGFTAPALYAIGQSSNYSMGFNDIADGSTNGYDGSGYKAVTGHDDATGWGSFKGAGLIQLLSQQ